MMRIVVVGGTGFIGRHLVRALAHAGHDALSIGRTAREGVAADITDRAALTQALSGADAVVVTAGINREVGGQTYERVHVDGTRAVVAAARAAGVGRVVLVSFLRARPDGPSEYHRSKWAAEEIVRESELEWTIVKPAVVYGRGDHLLDHTTRAVNTVPVFAPVGVRSRRLRPLAVSDLVRVLVAAAEGDATLRRRTVAIVGPDEVSFVEAVRRIAAVSGRRPLLVPLPVAVHRVLAVVWEAAMTVPLVARSQVEILAEGVVEPSPPTDVLPDDLLPRTPFNAKSIAAGLPVERRFGAADLRCALLRGLGA